MLIKKVTRYYAECGKGFWKRDRAINHEKACKCWDNPKNKTCKTCCYGVHHKSDLDTGEPAYWECSNHDFNGEHVSGLDGVDYISVNCEFYS